MNVREKYDLWINKNIEQKLKEELININDEKEI